MSEWLSGVEWRVSEMRCDAETAEVAKRRASAFVPTSCSPLAVGLGLISASYSEPHLSLSLSLLRLPPLSKSRRLLANRNRIGSV